MPKTIVQPVIKFRYLQTIPFYEISYLIIKMIMSSQIVTIVPKLVLIISREDLNYQYLPIMNLVFFHDRLFFSRHMVAYLYDWMNISARISMYIKHHTHEHLQAMGNNLKHYVGVQTKKWLKINLIILHYKSSMN